MAGHGLRREHRELPPTDDRPVPSAVMRPARLTIIGARVCLNLFQASLPFAFLILQHVRTHVSRTHVSLKPHVSTRHHEAPWCRGHANL